MLSHQMYFKVLHINLKCRANGDVDLRRCHFDVHVVVAIITNSHPKAHAHCVMFSGLVDRNIWSWIHREVHIGPIYLWDKQRKEQEDKPICS